MDEQRIEQSIKEIKDELKLLRVILTGDGTQLGLVGKFALMDSRITSLQGLMTNDFAHITARMDMEFRSRDVVDQTKEELREKLKCTEEELKMRIEDTKHKDIVSWKDVLLQWIKPVLVAIVTAIAVYFLTN